MPRWYTYKVDWLHRAVLYIVIIWLVDLNLAQRNVILMDEIMMFFYQPEDIHIKKATFRRWRRNLV